MRDALERHRSLQALVGLAIAALIIYIIQAIWGALTIVGDVFLIFLLAWIVHFILQPLSTRLERWRLPRVAAVSLIYLALLILVIAVAALAVPVLEAEVSSLTARVTLALSPHAGANGLAAQITSLLRTFGFNPLDAQSLANQVVTQARQVIGSYSHRSTGSDVQLFTTIGTVVFDATLTVIISFYMMLQGDVLVERLILRLPPRWLPDVRLFQRNINEIFAGFFRAQLIIAAIYAALTWIILAFFGLGDAWFVALISGALIWLPFIGVFLAVAPPLLLVAVVTPPNQLLIRLALLGLLLGAVQHIILNVVAPRIFGQHMRVPTLILFAALLLGAAEGGVWGAFFAGPVVAVAYAMIDVFYERFSSGSRLFQDEDVENDPVEGVEPRRFDTLDTSGSDPHDARNDTHDEAANGAAQAPPKPPLRAARRRSGRFHIRRLEDMRSDNQRE